MRTIKAALTAAIVTGGAAAVLAAAPVAAASPVGPVGPTCTSIGATTTQCTTNGSTSISTSPGTIAQPVWPYPYNDSWWGPSLQIGGW